MSLRVSLCLLCVWAGSVTLAAQTDPNVPAAARFRTEVVVTPERGETQRTEVPAATVVIEGTDLTTLPVVHPSEAIALLPGFYVARPEIYAGRPVVSARGFFGGGEAEYVRLLVDGVPVGDLESGLIDLSAVPLSSVRRIEASRGPGASLYGDSAIGGVIQIFTDRLTSEGQFTVTGGSFDTFTGDGSYSRRFRTAGLSLSTAARRTDGAYDHSAGSQLLIGGAADGVSHGLSWRWNVAGDTRERDDPGSLSRTMFAQTPSGSDPAYRFDNVDRQTFSTAVVVRQAASSWRPQGRVYIASRDEDLIRTIPLAPGLTDRRARALASTAIGGSLESERQLATTRPIVARFGIDLSREQLDTTYSSVGADGAVGALNSESDGHRVRSGLFASVSWEAAARVRLTTGVRWDDIGDHAFLSETNSGEPQRAWSPRAGVVMHVADRGMVNLFGQVSRAFKVPTLDQLFDPRPYPDFQGGTFTISNPTLVPQRATNVEAGVSGAGPVRWSVLAYHMNVDDEIDFDPRTFSYANIGESRHTGLELEADGRVGRLRPSITYALSRVVGAGEETQLKNVPRHTMSLAANVDLPWKVGLFGRYRASWGAFLDDENLLGIDGARAIDMRVHRPIGRHTIFADVMNLTGDTYEEFGFTLVSFTGAVVPYVYPGAPRAARVGATFAF